MKIYLEWMCTDIDEWYTISTEPFDSPEDPEEWYINRAEYEIEDFLRHLSSEPFTRLHESQIDKIIREIVKQENN